MERQPCAHNSIAHQNFVRSLSGGDLKIVQIYLRTVILSSYCRSSQLRFFCASLEEMCPKISIRKRVLTVQSCPALRTEPDCAAREKKFGWINQFLIKRERTGKFRLMLSELKLIQKSR